MSDDVKDEAAEAPVESAPAPESDNPYDFGDPSLADRDDDESDAPEPEADEADAEEAEPEPEQEPQDEKPEPAPKRKAEVDSADEDGEVSAFDPSAFLDEELATIVRRQASQISRLEQMIASAGIMAPKDAAISKVGERFPDTFGGKGAPPSPEQAEARQRLSEAADILRTTYVKRGKAAPGWDDLLGVAMSVEFPDLARKAATQQAKAVRRDSQRIARPAARETSLSREERAVRAARKMMLENAAFSSQVPDLG
jgi:hypothetical protein